MDGLSPGRTDGEEVGCGFVGRVPPAPGHAPDDFGGCDHVYAARQGTGDLEAQIIRRVLRGAAAQRTGTAAARGPDAADLPFAAAQLVGNFPVGQLHQPVLEAADRRVVVEAGHFFWRRR